jgi:ribonuclease HI
VDGQTDLASLTQRAKRLAAAGQWDGEAAALNARILELHPRSLAACNRLAACCLHLAQLDRAEKLSHHVLKYDPHNLTAQQHLDAVTIRRQHQEMADKITTFEDAFLRGLHARKRGNNHLAVVLLERACSLRPYDAYRIALAASYRATGRLADAETTYRSILERGFNKAAAVGLAGVLRDQGRVVKAAELDREVLRGYPDDSHAHRNLLSIPADREKPPWERKSAVVGGVALTRSTEGREMPHRPADPVQIYFDGLCEPRNPGGYACGGWYVAPHPDVPALATGLEGHAFFRKGPGATNNVAEYSAAIAVLRAVYAGGYRGPVSVHGDSQLVVNQFNGAWQCNKPALQELLDQLRHAATFFEQATMTWVPREENTRADELSRQAYREITRSTPAS